MAFPFPGQSQGGIYGGIASTFDPFAPNEKLPINTFGSPTNFAAGASQQASDYDKIMQQYADLAANYRNNPVTATNINAPTISPQTTPYTQSADVTKSIGTLGNLAQTGGYSPGQIADIRARDIAPTRSIYANAMQNLNQNRALQGGYSPSFNATQAQLARDESNAISNETTAANAGIAQNVVANELAAASPYASASASANQTKLAADQANTNIVNQINEANAQRNLSAQQSNQQANLESQFANRQGPLSIMGGETGLYGTTPALTSTFGNQVMQAVQANQGQQGINQRNLGMLLGAAAA